MYKTDALIDGYREQMVSLLQQLVAIPSVKSAPQDGFPFGKPIDDCLRFALKAAQEIGMQTAYVDGYAGHADIGSGDQTLGVLVHLDVVPEGTGWETPPFAGTVRDGCVLGRGSADNKAASVAALFAVKACLEAGVALDQKKIRIIFGCDEESGWDDIAYYKTQYEMPDFGFSPDASFPLYNAEKGIFHSLIRVPAHGDDAKILSFVSGERPNVVCSEAQIVLDGCYELNLDGFDAQSQIQDGKTYLTVRGRAAHAASLEQGVNAATRAMQLLRLNGFSGNGIDVVCDRIGDGLHGEHFGVALRDEVSGPLTLNLGIVRKTSDGFELTIDIRYPCTVPFEQVHDEMLKRLEPFGASLEVLEQKDPLYLPKDHPWIQMLLDVYHDCTGLPAYTMSMGGGTYARALKNAVAFGCGFPDSAHGHNAHAPNEFFPIDDMVRACKVFARLFEAAQQLELE